MSRISHLSIVDQEIWQYSEHWLQMFDRVGFVVTSGMFSILREDLPETDGRDVACGPAQALGIRRALIFPPPLVADKHDDQEDAQEQWQ